MTPDTPGEFFEILTHRLRRCKIIRAANVGRVGRMGRICMFGVDVDGIEEVPKDSRGVGVLAPLASLAETDEITMGGVTDDGLGRGIGISWGNGRVDLGTFESN